MFGKMSYEKGLDAGFIVAGWDPYVGSGIYNINLGGACIERDWTMAGSGSTFIYGFVDSNWKVLT
jgi:20S proteasome subunit beta 1